MNQSIEAVEARDRADQSMALYFSNLETYRATGRDVSPWSYDSYEELDGAMRRAAGPMLTPTSDELDRMMAQWATRSTPPAYVAEAAAAATSAT